MDYDAIGTWLGIGLAVAGFGVTWWQLWRTRTAAEAARDAVVATESRLAVNQLLILFSQLQQIEAELDVACARDDREGAVRAFTRWCNAGSETIGILRAGSREDSLANVLREAVDVSAAAKSILLATRRRSLDAATADARVAIGRATAASSAYLGRLRAYTEGRDG